MDFIGWALFFVIRNLTVIAKLARIVYLKLFPLAFLNYIPTFKGDP